jgi:osomolarity two-component system phosphorelay intermediate protein YPD1
MNVIDEDIFQQLLEMDDDDQHEFTISILDDFFSQMDESMGKFNALMEQKDYDSVKKLGHYLKGSSGGVGAANIRDICEKIQHYDLNEPDVSKQEVYLQSLVSRLPENTSIAKQQLYARVGK